MTKEEYAALRKKAGMTHQAMADFLGVDIRTAQRYESGEIILDGAKNGTGPVLKLLEILKQRAERKK
jgi:DNA-binding transcriptional regulator YiaG